MDKENVKPRSWKNALPDVLCVVLFAAIAFLYFCPADIEGRRLTGHDHDANSALAVEINQYRDAHDGETPRWINSIFGGMPTYQIAPSYGSTDTLKAVENAYHLWLPDYVWYIFASMLGFYILLRAFDFRQWMAALGAVVWAFSSYFFIIIAAGHIWKVITLAYIPPTIAGMVLCYRGKYLWGSIVTALFAALQIAGNHIQMTYYFLIPCIAIAVAFLVDAVRQKRLLQFGKATAVMAAAVVVAVAVNGSNLYHTYKYSKETMRAKSELVKQGKESDQTDSGLERSYITNWSYGVGETMTLLVPNFRGGASVPLAANEELMKKADFNVPSQFYGYFTEYWGEQPMTSGPVYVGALVCLLFVLALIVLPNTPLKWALVAATMLSILLSWGKNFMPFTDFFIDHVPMYAKFRTVSSILVVAEFTIPLLALLGLKEFVDRIGEADQRQRLLRAAVVSTAVTGGICLLLAVCPSLAGSFVSQANDVPMWAQFEDLYRGQGVDAELNQLHGALFTSMEAMRRGLLTADAWRSFGFIAVGFLLLYWYYRNTGKILKENKLLEKQQMKTTADGVSPLRLPTTILCIALLAVATFDMWTVNQRYLNDDMFQHPQTASIPTATPIDDQILQVSGTARNYRVFDQRNFANNSTAYRYASIGGYHAAKLRRYQELIDAYIMKGNADVLNMLNTQWVITTNPNTGEPYPFRNEKAYGNAWLVDTLLFVDDANQELAALAEHSPRTTAIVDRTFADIIGQQQPPARAEGDTIRQTALTSTSVTYDVDTRNGAIAVFSEIYYPDWTATIDGKPADIARADYVLRTMRIPAGKHTIVMTFEPTSVATTETIAYVALALLAIAVVAAVVVAVMRNRRKEA